VPATRHLVHHRQFYYLQIIYYRSLIYLKAPVDALLRKKSFVDQNSHYGQQLRKVGLF
jgi:hypothetical protein